MQEAFGLEVGPKLKLVHRHGVHVVGGVPVGLGVQAFAAGALDDLAELVGDDELVGLGDGVFPDLLQFSDFGVVAADPLVAFKKVSVVGLFNFLECYFLGGPVFGADG